MRRLSFLILSTFLTASFVSCKKKSKLILGDWEIYKIDTCGTSASENLGWPESHCSYTNLSGSSSIDVTITAEHWGYPIDTSYVLSKSRVHSDNPYYFSRLWWDYDRKADELVLNHMSIYSITWQMRRR